MTSYPQATALEEALAKLSPEDRDAVYAYDRWLLSNIRTLYNSLGMEQGECRGCQRPIWWGITKHGKRAPFTEEGLNHFADCPARGEFRR